jgi:hypothetical protein
MPSYPVADDQSIREGLDYLLSGPAGLGQNFQGFSSSDVGYVTGNFRLPYGSTTPVPLYVAPISLGTSQVLTPGNMWQLTFASAQPTAPFTLGSPIVVTGAADSFYNGSYQPIGAVICTTTAVTARTVGFYPGYPSTTGGTVKFSVINLGEVSTDCNARVNVTGGTDRVFVSGQFTAKISYSGSVSSNLTYTVAINRYVGFENDDPVNPDYRFLFDKTIAQQVYSGGSYSGLTGTGTITQSTVFGTVVDNPPIGYYWYILELRFDRSVGDVEITQCETGLRSLSAQVVKP